MTLREACTHQLGFEGRNFKLQGVDDLARMERGWHLAPLGRTVTQGGKCRA